MGLFDITPQALKVAEQASSFHLTVPAEGSVRPKGSTDQREGIWSEIVEITSAEYETQTNGDVTVELQCLVLFESPNEDNHNRTFRVRYNFYPQAMKVADKGDWQYKVTNMNLPRLRGLFLASGVEGDLPGDDHEPSGYSKELQEEFFGTDSRLVGQKFWAKIRQTVRKDRNDQERVNTDVTHWMTVD